MPGGRGGPHRISGVGFWAQQSFYGIPKIDYGPFIFRPPLRGLPEAWWVPPANAFQSWTVTPSLPLLTAVPTVTVFRPPLKGLPEQPFRPEFTWVKSGNALFSTITVALPPGLGPTNQDDWPNPQQPWRLDQTWTRSYNLNLIGQDAMLVGEQRYELAPSQVRPDQIQLRSWQWSYNLSLIGKDRLPTGEQTFDLSPKQVPSEQIQLHSWSWQYNLNLIGKDQLITGEQVYDLPPRDPREVRTWSYQYNLNLIGQDRFPSGEQFWERPTLPIPPAAPAWYWQYNPNLIGQDLLPFRQLSWPLPIAPQQPALSWVDPVKIWLTVPVLNITVSQYWDRPQLPVPPAQTWTWSYNLNLIGQDRMVTGQQLTDLPPRDFVRLFQTWISAVNAALVVTPPVLDILKPQRDWPVPKGPEPDWRRSWEWQYNKNLIGQDQLPFRQTDWPNPVAPPQVQGWIDQTKILLAQPSGPLDVVANQFDWPLPQRQPQQIQTWTNTITALILGAKPFAQTDWPNPTPFARDPTLASIAASYNQNLIGQDRLPNRQQDWPLPQTAEYTLHRGFILPLNIPLLAPPALLPPLYLRNQDWPNPTAPLYANNLRAWPTQGSPPTIIPGVPPPPVAGPAVYNKPMLAGPGYLDVIPGEKPS
jgi:hypothetical protein